FCPYANLCPGPSYGSIYFNIDMFVHYYTPWKSSNKLFMNPFTLCGSMSVCTLVFF
ncbi:hypothetical protein K443DRAFT_61503, partial [Laccaria amethystina LaAM-08-1]